MGKIGKLETKGKVQLIVNESTRCFNYNQQDDCNTNDELIINESHNNNKGNNNKGNNNKSYSKEYDRSTYVDQKIILLFNSPHLRLNKKIIQTQGTDIALWLADIFSRWSYFYENKKLTNNGYFYVTKKTIRETTNLNYNKQSEIIKTLSEKKVIDVKRMGSPGRNYYRINIQNLVKLIEDASPDIIKLSDVSIEVKELFELWQSLNIVVHRRVKGRNKILRILHSKQKRYGSDVIKNAMRKYKELMGNKLVILHKKPPYRVGLHEFFGFSPESKELLSMKRYEHISTVKSWFDECQKESHEHLIVVMKDHNPNVTNKLKREYNEKISKLPDVLTPDVERNFRNSSIIICDFLKKNKTKLRIDTIMKRNPVQFVPLFFEYLEIHQNNGSAVHSGWLVNSFKDYLFPKWLYDTNRVIEGKNLTKVLED